MKIKYLDHIEKVGNFSELTVTFQGNTYQYYDEYKGSVSIPESVEYDGKTYSVTRISAYAFRLCSSLTSVTIPNTVTRIDSNVFSQCSNLTSVTIPNSVTSIGKGAFSMCDKLTSINLPTSLTSIEDDMFFGCNNLTNIIIPNSVISIGSYAFHGCESLTEIDIPNSVIYLDDEAFSSCYKITRINIPNSVTYIGNKVFENCKKLMSVTIPNSVSCIGDYAFSGCTSLTYIKLPSSVACIGEEAFKGCTNLTDFYSYTKALPIAQDGLFTNTNIQNGTLYVPESLKSKYKANSPWNKFKEYASIPNYTLSYIIDGEIYKSYQYEEYCRIVIEAAPEKEHYTFTGWSEIPETMPAHDVEVTGSFTINTYKLTYMVDGVEYKVADVEYGATIVPEEAPEKPSYAFTSWDNLPETMPAHDVTVTATYEKTFLGKCATPTIAFKDGKFKFESEEEGVEFVWNINVVGNSGKGSELGTPRKYVLSVCATKEFYEDSEPATMEMGMSSPIGDVNGDGVVNAADIATLVDIILHM